jgi:hypothetical protein
MKNNKNIKIVTMLLGIGGSLILGSLITLFIISFLSYKFHWFEGMTLMLALFLIMPLGGIASAIITGIFYNRRLKKILEGELIRKKELALLIILPTLLILISLFPKFTNLYSQLSPSPKINFTDAMGKLFYSSSELNKPAGNEFGEYGEQNLFDHDKNTCWAEGVEGPGVGEYVYLNMPPDPAGISIINGYAKTDKTFKNNNRVKQVKISLYKLFPPKEGEVSELYTPIKVKKLSFYLIRPLKDSYAPQKIYFPKKWRALINKKGETALKTEIFSVYKGDKYDDTCLSEINYFDEEPSKLFLSKNDQELWMEKSGRKSLLLKSEKDMFFQIISNEGDWAILTKMPVQTEGRVESQFFLFNTHLKKEADLSKSGFTAIYGFIPDDKELFIDAFDNITSKQIRINVKDIKFKKK